MRCLMSENVACRGPAPRCRETLTPGVVMGVGEPPPPTGWSRGGGGDGSMVAG